MITNAELDEIEAKIHNRSQAKTAINKLVAEVRKSNARDVFLAEASKNLTELLEEVEELRAFKVKVQKLS
jgi:hypothetical protein